jgi:hypothetical protein
MSDGNNYKSTMQPFEPGDIFLGCTLLNDPTDDHAGAGRILQFDADLKPKGELYTEGGNHLVGGLSFAPDGVLWAFNDLSVIHVDPRTGRQLPLSGKFLPRVYRSASFGPDGSVYLGEHMLAKDPPKGIEKLTTTKFPRIPGDNVLGYGMIYKYDASWNLVKAWDVDHCPELTGFKGVTHSTLHPSGEYITYTAETGKRIMRFDVVREQQMPDLVRYPGDDIRDGNWAIAVRYLPDGRLLVTRGKTMDLLDEDGKLLRTYELEGYGWAEIAVGRSPQEVLLANIWTGLAWRYDLDRGECTGVIDTGMKAPRRSLAGIAQYPG